MRDFLQRCEGATAVEFAIIAPLFFSMVFGTIVMGIAIWNTAILNQVAAESARCVAVGGPACTALPAGCVSVAATCFVMTLASDRGIPGLTPSDIQIDRAAQIGAALSTRVTVAQPFALLGYSIALSASASYPNS